MLKRKKTLVLTAALVTALAASAPALAADALPAGTLITGTATGAAPRLLGLDHLFADEPGSNITALAASDLEFMTSDFAAAVDLFTDGTIQFWNNTGAAALPGSYTLTLSFSGLGQNITAFDLADLSGINGGTVSTAVLNDHSVSITFNNLSFTSEFGSFSAHLEVSPVPEPGTMALFGVGLAGLLAGGLRRARRAA